MRIIDYDKIDTWELWISEALFPCDLDEFKRNLKSEEPKYIEDAADVVIDTIGLENTASRLDKVLQSCGVRLYHGTRLSDEELKSIKCNGLKPLVLKDRKELLTDLLSHHSEWSEVKHRLDEVLDEFGPGQKGGLREDNSAHACFSRKGLICGCNHYLTHGAEVDGQVVYRLFNSDRSALELLRNGRNPYLVSFIKPYKEALNGANPFGFEDGELPNLLRLLLNAWAYKQYDDSFNPERLENCTAAIFRGGVDANEIEQFELLSDKELVIDL